MQKLTRERDVSIDFLKAIAIVGVVIIHGCSPGYQNPLGGFEWLCTLLWGSVARGSVPLFLMCSGALLLDPERELPLKKLYGKNMLRLVVAMVFWAMCYKCYHLAGESALTFYRLVQSVKEVLLFQQEFHFYYLHMMLLVYAFLPVTRLFVKYAKKEQLEYALLLWFAVGILYPTVKPFRPFCLLSGMALQWHLNMTYASIGYGMLGYYLKRYSVSKQLGWAMLLVGTSFTFGATWAMSLHSGALYTNFLEGMSFGPALLAAGLFALGTSRKNFSFSGLWMFLSKASFCIYLVHIFSFSLLGKLGITVELGPCFFTIPVVVACNLLISCLVYWIFCHIPLAKSYLV